MTIISSDDGLALEGLYHSGREPRPVLIAGPHPRLGGSMDSPVCAELAWACSQRGHATLRFNYRGVGASAGEVCGDARDEADLRAALRHLQDTHPDQHCAVIGYSFGASLLAAALTKGLRVGRVVLIAPAASTGLVDWARCPDLGSRCLVAVGRSDALVDQDLWQGPTPPLGAQVCFLDEADHVFSRGLSELGRLCAEHVASPRSSAGP